MSLTRRGQSFFHIYPNLKNTFPVTDRLFYKTRIHCMHLPHVWVFCSYSLSSLNRKEVALKENQITHRLRRTPRGKRDPSLFFNRLSVAQTKKNTDDPSCFTAFAAMRVPPGFFFAAAILSLFYFYRSGTYCYFPLPPSPPLKMSVRDRGEETMSHCSPLLLLTPPARAFFFLCVS